MNKTTLNSQKEKHSIANFYPRSPCGERLLRRFPNMSLRIISIHALLAESDLDALCARCPGLKFLSTLSLRRATHNLEELGYLLIISIHALLAESDRLEAPMTLPD